MYSLYQLVKERKLLRADGKPFLTKKGVRRRLKKFNFQATRYNQQAELTYDITEEQVAMMNSWPELKAKV